MNNKLKVEKFSPYIIKSLFEERFTLGYELLEKKWQYLSNAENMMRDPEDREGSCQLYFLFEPENRIFRTDIKISLEEHYSIEVKMKFFNEACEVIKINNKWEFVYN